MSEWKNLITINYMHGYCGDFIANIIMGNPIVLSKGLSCTYTTPGITSSHGVKNIDFIVGLKVNPIYKQYLDRNIEHNKQFLTRQYNYFKTVDDPTIDGFVDNLTYDMRTQFNHLVGTKTVYNTHHCYENQKVVSLQQIFPGSFNVGLFHESEATFQAFKFFFKHKVKHHYGNPIYEFYKERVPQFFNNEYLIFVDRLLFEEGFEYAEQLEKDLNITIDRIALSEYKMLHKILLLSESIDYESLYNRKPIKGIGESTGGSVSERDVPKPRNRTRSDTKPRKSKSSRANSKE